jgi:addiction module RelE/StbE family toxin
MKKTKHSVLVYPTAEKDLLEIKDYFENKLKISVNGLFEKFDKQIDLLEENPFIHSLVKDPYLNQLGYRMIPVDNFLVFYIVSDNTVQVHRFLYGKRDYQQIL